MKTLTHTLSAFVLLVLLALLYIPAFAASIDRVVAYIEDSAITMRELTVEHERMAKLYPDRTMEQTLESLINTRLILINAKILRLTAETDEAMIEKYLNLKVRSLVSVTEAEIRAFYDLNSKGQGKASKSNKAYNKARPEIEKYLFEIKFNEIVKAHMKTLRAASLIRILEF